MDSDVLTELRKADHPVRLAEKSSPIAKALAISALLHAAVFLIFGAVAGAKFSRPWMQGSGVSMTIVSLAHAPSPDSADAMPGVLTWDASESGAAPPGGSASGSTPDVGPALDTSGRNGPSESTPVALLPQVHYFPTNELDTRPGIMVHINPEYPPGALAEGTTGLAVVRIYINESGEVDDVVAISGKPPGVFEESAVRAFRLARFSPGAKGGIPVKTFTTLEVLYDLPQAELRPR